MKSADEVKPVIQKIYRTNIKKKLGKISNISIVNLVYRVVVETDEKEILFTEVQRKFIDDYIDNNDKQAMHCIIDALNNFRPVSI